MKPILHVIILESRSAIISSRLILGDTMVAFEMLYSIKKILKSKKGRVLIKLDKYKVMIELSGSSQNIC